MTITNIYGDSEFLIKRRLNLEVDSLLEKKVSSYESYDEFINSYWTDNTSVCVIHIDDGNVVEMSLLRRYKASFLVSKKEISGGSDRSVQIIAPKPYESEKIIKFIIDEGNLLSVDLSCVAMQIYMNVGDQLEKLHSEIKKISDLFSGKRPTFSDVSGILSFSRSFDPQKIIESIVTKKVSMATHIYNVMQDANDETGWIAVTLQSFIIKSMQYEACGFKNDAFAKASGLHPFVIEKQWSLYKGYITGAKGKLSNFFDSLIEVDILHKSGNEYSKVLLEKIIIDMCSC